jgi:hypothetical protein
LTLVRRGRAKERLLWERKSGVEESGPDMPAASDLISISPNLLSLHRLWLIVYRGGQWQGDLKEQPGKGVRIVQQPKGLGAKNSR